jgi:1-deoxy-D-xylulose-5-phosphate synthase
VGLLSSIRSPEDLKRLSDAQMTELAADIRRFLVAEVAKSGGHLGPNLGVVELTLAMHRVFDSPRDPFVFDTGHQSYVHKLVTGRQDFSKLRERGGIAGYPQRSESQHDIVESSHASSSLSWADGISRAFQRTDQADRTVVVVVGDGALTGGMTWEALNNISDGNDRRLVIIVNDNGRSYAPTIGGMARFLNSVRTRREYRALYEKTRDFADHFGTPGRAVYRGMRGGMHGFLSRFTNNEALYSNLDIKYIGPVDGHDEKAMEAALRQAKDYGAPVIVHAITEKGHGFEPALKDTADQFHAVGHIDPETGESLDAKSGPTWTDVFSEELARIGDQDPRVVAITAAMLRPTGLHRFQERHPERVYDVGIAEQHAVTLAAGLAYGGLHPVVALYATFMNRAFDQVLMDVALHKAGVTFVLDRAGITGPDGPSHHGMWDLAILQVVPGIRIAAPRDASTLREEFDEAVAIDDAPTVVRFSKGSVGPDIEAVRRLPDGVDVLRVPRDAPTDADADADASTDAESGVDRGSDGSDEDVLIVAVGSMAPIALEAAALLEAQGIGTTVVDPRWVVPIAPSLIDLARDHRLVITLEDGVRVGGIGTRLRQDLRAAGVDTGVNELGLPDAFIDHASRGQILDQVGLSAQAIARDVIDQVVGTKLPQAKPARTRTRAS